ncbi:MAG: septal ring factor EnvC (AmiA/AmiB activator) [Lysobacterales bacterium]|jgi:septal ring factor EnvC (AmiA/AmiB activator)
MKVNSHAKILLVTGIFAFTNTYGQNGISKEEAESRLEALKTEIILVQKALTRSRQLFAKEQAILKAVDLDIQTGALKIRELNTQTTGLEQDLQQLGLDRIDYLESLSSKKTQLGQQIVSAYQLGRESRLKLLLNQDSPARLSRMLAYYDYISRAQVGQIEDLRTAITTLDRMQEGIDSKLLELDSIREISATELSGLQVRRDQRQAVIAGLAGQIDSEKAKLDELGRNRADLESLLQRLSSVLTDIPSELGQYINTREQRGNIPVPIKGRVLHAFGQSRLGGLNWQGWLIEAEPGKEVQAIAYGRVAFSDWLRGYGLLMIIDHGDGIMSLYGHNESLLYSVGDWVQPGTVISTVGENSGNDQGLYFELRNNGKAVDPASWLDR